MAKLYIVSGREGTDMHAPQVFKNKSDADNYIKDEIASCVLDNFSDTLEEENIDTENLDDILSWAEANDYVTDYNNTGFPDTYTYCCDYIEFRQTEVDTDLL